MQYILTNYIDTVFWIYPTDIIFSEIHELKNLNKKVRKKDLIIFGGRMSFVAKSKLHFLKSDVDKVLEKLIYEKLISCFME